MAQVIIDYDEYQKLLEASGNREDKMLRELRSAMDVSMNHARLIDNSTLDDRYLIPISLDRLEDWLLELMDISKDKFRIDFRRR